MFVRSVLWIGSGERFAADLVGGAPLVDVIWEPDLAAAAHHRSTPFDAVVLDAEEPDHALAGLQVLRDAADGPPIIVRTNSGSDAAADRLRGAGAAEVWLPGEEPTCSGELVERLDTLKRPASRSTSRRRKLQLVAPSPARGIIGESAAMLEIFALVERAGRTPVTVLLSGETGTGKEVLAQAIHRGTVGRDGPFVAINCAAFPAALLESELFGHVRGAFTGADRDKKGLFEAANGGTIFLDEVSETSGPFQAKLLRALQERELRPVGGSKVRRIDARVIAASNRDLWLDAVAGRFRKDLFYRLAVFPITIPPLRERSRDILPLARHFLEMHTPKHEAPHELSEAAIQQLQSYHWPGNARELDNEIQRALAIAIAGEELLPEHFSSRLFDNFEPIEAALDTDGSLRDNVARFEAVFIRRALEANGGRRAATARRLRLTREGLYKKMKRLGIE